MLFKSIGCVILSVFLLSCSAGSPVQLESQKFEKDSIAVQYSILLVIHGDNDYLYHDTSGNKYKADEKTLAEAIRVAQQNPNAEVFIFHQKPRSHFLFFFPLRDGEFYYYRNGLLIANELYWRDQELSNLDNEVKFYKSFRTESQPERVSMFLYFGHEIPEFGGAGYDASYPDRTFTVHDLANGMKGLTTDSTKFDLLVLSTCYGGTPYSIGTLGPYARTVIASPDNLHLSYFDLSSLESLNLGLQDGDVPAFANRFAQQSFDRLTRNVQTAVSVAVYDIDSVQEYLHFVYPTYENTLNTLSEKKKTFPATIEHCDCADIPEYVRPTMNRGVNVYYRPALFGRLKSKQNHSGWECRKD
ncbi:MAG: hypothetical protein U5J96_18860 [Ignavibacteriaceae bacterium]|nr:hypothetical protein [Ignavibacteriaceae bacterium]